LEKETNTSIFPSFVFVSSLPSPEKTRRSMVVYTSWDDIWNNGRKLKNLKHRHKFLVSICVVNCIFFCKMSKQVWFSDFDSFRNSWDHQARWFVRPIWSIQMDSNMLRGSSPNVIYIARGGLRKW
jgi:hypothetical protein